MAAPLWVRQRTAQRLCAPPPATKEEPAAVNIEKLNTLQLSCYDEDDLPATL